MKIWMLAALAVVIVPATSFAQVEKGAYYRLHSQFQADKCLEANGPDSKVENGNSFFDTCQNVTGQQWTFVDQGNGYYRMQCRANKSARSLEGNQKGSDTMHGAAFMDKTQEVSGQLWKIEKTDQPGFYRLKTQFRGEGECLEGNRVNGSAKAGAAFMDSCQNVSGQLWKFEKLR